MQVQSFNININSPDPERLVAFYRDVIGLPENPELGHCVVAGGAMLFFDGHDEITGPTREPARVLINFFVDDLAAEQARPQGQGGRLLGGEVVREPWGGVISTFLDPDGNYVQLLEFTPEAQG